MQRDIRAYVNGNPSVEEPPRDADLIAVGCKIFDTLFPGEVRRLYDIARAGQRTGRLNIIFTSEIDWVADLPWEFIYDPGRQVFLATSELNFTRNVITAVPADRLSGRPGALRILVVVAQPVGLAHLSVEEETEVIRAGFQRLIDGGLATVDVLLDATPDALHRRLETADVFDVVHFIGHGEFDEREGKGFLIFQDAQGRVQRVDPPQPPADLLPSRDPAGLPERLRDGRRRRARSSIAAWRNRSSPAACRASSPISTASSISAPPLSPSTSTGRSPKA